MKSIRFGLRTTAIILGAAAVLTATAAFAQGPPPGGGFGGFGGGGGFGVSATNIAMDILTPELKLTPAEVTKIKAIKAKFEKERTALMPSFGNPADGPPDFEAMRANMQKMRTLQTAAAKDINAALTDDQATSLKALIAVLDDVQTAGIPIGTYETVKLTDDEKTQLATIAKEKRAKMQKMFQDARESQDFSSVFGDMQDLNEHTSELALAVLTDDQKTIVKAYKEAHPQPAFGGGFGGPPPPANN